MRISLEESIRRIEAGEVVAIPTDTVYGLASHSADKIAALKGRSEERPILMLAANLEQVREWVGELPPGFEEMARQVWPGAVSLVLPQGGFRVPDHPLALQLLERTGPLLASSANRTGEPPASSPEEVEAIFGDLPLLDGGRCSHGKASAILKYDGEWKKIR